MENEITEGMVVYHLTDSHCRNEGVVIEQPSTRRKNYGLCKVRWVSGVVENVHVSELRKKEQ